MRVKKQIKRKLPLLFWTSVLTMQNAITAMADLPPSIDDDKFKDMTAQGVPSMILGAVIWFMRLAGVIVLMSGVYRMLSARKSGEADEMNLAMIKVFIGICFVCFPAILKALRVIA